MKELSAQTEARNMFLQSVSLTPLLWASWQELAKICEDRAMVSVGQHYITSRVVTKKLMTHMIILCVSSPCNLIELSIGELL